MAVLYFLGTLLMIALPLGLASVLARRRQVDWGLFGMGAATFVGSQLLHIPFNLLVERAGWLPADLSVIVNLLVVSLFLGLSAGFFEEVARYLTYRFWARDARRWRAGLMLGAGHGGIEAMILGLLALVNTVALFGMRDGYFTALVPAEQFPLAQAQAQALLDGAWYDALLAPAERLFALAAHLSLSLLVMEGFIRGRQGRWLAVAIAWHALLDALVVFTTVRWDIYVAEGVLAVFALACVGIIFLLRRPVQAANVQAPEPGPAPEPAVIEAVEVELTPEKLEQSRFQ